jgi:surface protein
VLVTVTITSLNGSALYFVDDTNTQCAKELTTGIAVLRCIPTTIGDYTAEIYKNKRNLVKYKSSEVTYESTGVTSIDVLASKDGGTTELLIADNLSATGSAPINLLYSDFSNGDTLTIKVKDSSSLLNDTITSSIPAAQPFVATFGWSNPFILQLPLVQGENIGQPDELIYEYNFDIDWGDGSPVQHISSWDDPKNYHFYQFADDYVITITGTMQMWRFYDYETDSNIGLAAGLKSISSLGNVSFGKSVRNYSGMFLQCLALPSVPLFDTSTGTDFSGMFAYCGDMTTVPLFNTSNATNMSQMFYGTQELTEIPLFDTSKNTSFYDMFNGSGVITIPALDTSSGTDFGYMFASSQLTTLPLIDTSNGIWFTRMFYGCTNLVSLPDLDTSNGIRFTSMLEGCTNLIVVPEFELGSSQIFDEQEPLENMFSGCTSVQSSLVVGTKDNIDYISCPLEDADDRDVIFANLEVVSFPVSSTIYFDSNGFTQDPLTKEFYITDLGFGTLGTTNSNGELTLGIVGQIIVTIISPTTGQDIPANSIIDIVWEAENINTVDISYSTNGSDFILIVSNVPSGNYSYTWVTPSFVGDVIIKIESDTGETDIVTYSANSLPLIGDMLLSEMTVSEETIPINPTFLISSIEILDTVCQITHGGNIETEVTVTGGTLAMNQTYIFTEITVTGGSL